MDIINELKRRRKTIVIAAFFFIAILLALAIAKLSGPHKDGLVVHRGTFTNHLLLTGELKAEKSDDILVPTFRQWRTQITWMIRDGSKVHKGDKILALDFTSQASNLEEKKLEVSKARGELAQQKALNRAERDNLTVNLEKARSAYEKARLDASAPRKFYSRKDYEGLQLALNKAKAEFEKAKSRMDSFRISSMSDIKVKRLALQKALREADTAREALNKMVVYAPISGLIDVADHPWEGRKFQIGDTVFVGWTVIRIPDLSTMSVDAELSDVDQGRLQPGMRAVCTMDAFPDLKINGYVSRVSPVARPVRNSPTRRGFDVKINLEKTYPDKMRSGMSVRAEVLTRKIENALIAPREGLDFSVGPPLARLRGGRKTSVKLGPCSPFECVVVSGLKEGQRLRPPGDARD